MRISDLPNRFGVLVERDGEIQSVGTLRHRRPGMLVFAEREDFLAVALNAPNITFIITTRDLVSKVPSGLGVAVAERPRVSFFLIHNHLAENTDFFGTGFDTEIDPTATIHPRAYISERNVRVGIGTQVKAGAVVLEHSILGRNVIVGENTVIGSEGFEFQRIDGELVKIRQVGGVEIHDEVEIQSSTCVDRAVFGGHTTLGRQTKIDNIVHIAHDVITGERCMIVAGAMLAGNVVLEDDVWIGPMASVSNGLSIGEGGYVTLGSVVTKSVEPHTRVTGNFAIEHDRFISFLRSIR